MTLSLTVCRPYLPLEFSVNFFWRVVIVECNALPVEYVVGEIAVPGPQW